MSNTHPPDGREPVAPALTQAALGDVRAGNIRNDIAVNIQPDSNGVIAPLRFSPPGGTSGWQRVRVANYTPYPFQVIGIPGGGNGDPPQIIQPFQQNVWPYYASRGTITLLAAQEGSPLAVPPLRFFYTGAGELLANFVTIEWCDTADLFFGYYPVPLTGIAIEAVAASISNVIGVGTDPLGITRNGTTNRLYVSNNGDNTVSVIDEASNTVTATIPVAAGPRGIAADEINNKVYVACSTAGRVDIIDGNLNTVVGFLTVAGAYDVCFDLANQKKYVSDNGTHVYPISAADVLGAAIAVGNGPRGIDANQTGFAYVANHGDDTVSVIDEATDTVVGLPIAVGSGPEGVAIAGAPNIIYVTNSTAGPPGTVSVIDGATNTVIHTVVVGDDPIAVAAHLAGTNQTAYVVNNGSNTISVVNHLTGTVVDTLNPGVGPLAVVFDHFFANRIAVTLTAGAVVILEPAE